MSCFGIYFFILKPLKRAWSSPMKRVKKKLSSSTVIIRESGLSESLETNEGSSKVSYSYSLESSNLTVSQETILI